MSETTQDAEPAVSSNLPPLHHHHYYDYYCYYYYLRCTHFLSVSPRQLTPAVNHIAVTKDALC